MAFNLAGIIAALLEFGETSLAHFVASIAAHSVTNRKDQLPARTEAGRSSGAQEELHPSLDNEDRFRRASSHREELADRFDAILALLNEGAEHDKLTTPKLARLLGLQKVEELERYVEGIEEPPKAFLDSFANQLGISPQWLDLGEGVPFPPLDNRHGYTPDLIDEILTLKPRAIYFVRNDSASGEAGIVCAFDRWHYRRTQDHWCLSGEVGAEAGRG